jgi:nucleoside phosphorylase
MQGAGAVALVTALPEELAALRRLSRAGGLGGRRILLARTGDGARRAATLDAFLAVHPADLVIGAGVAGGLSPDLAIGDVVVAMAVRDPDGPAPLPDPTWTRRALDQGARGATFVSSRDVLATSEAKATALAALPAGTTGAVDMESAAWARAASARGVPYVIVRAISDAANEPLPSLLAGCLDPEGGISRSRVIGRALVHPSSLPELWRLRLRIRDAMERLVDFIERLLASPHP